MILDLAVKPLEDFRAPFRTMKLAPVTIMCYQTEHTYIHTCCIVSDREREREKKASCTYAALTFSWFIVYINRMCCVRILVVAMRVLYTNEV